jgi:hypothetical protein
MKTSYFFLLVCMLGSSMQSFSQTITGAQKYYYHPKDTIRIKGSNFNTSSSSVFIRLGGTYIRPISMTSSTISFIAPNDLYSGKVFYQDTANNKFTVSHFTLHISTQFEGASTIDKSSFERQKSVLLDTMPSDFMREAYFADFNNDGINEMLIFKNDGTFSMLRKKNGNFEPTTSINANNGSIYSFSDFNGDGKLDIIIYEYSTKVVLWQNTTRNDSISFKNVAEQGFSGILSDNPFRTIDFNGDGRPDLISYYHFDPTDSFILLNKIDSSGKPMFVKVPADSGFIKINNMRPINLDNDSLTDMMALPYYGNSRIIFFKNVSRGDSIHFIEVDSMVGYNNIDEYGEYDFNKDLVNDIFIRVYKPNSAKLYTHILLNKSSGSTVKLKHIVSDMNSQEQYTSLLWDYNSDSIPDIFYSYEDSIFCKTLSWKNDTLVHTKSLLNISSDRTLVAVQDIDDNNQPDLVCRNFYDKKLHFLLSDAYNMRLETPTVTFLADSSNQVFYDSFSLTYKSGKALDIDTLTNKSGLLLFNSNTYTNPLTFPIRFIKDSTYTFYFKYTYKKDMEDSIIVNHLSYLNIGILKSKLLAPCAIIHSIDKPLARPGDTLSIKGKYLYKKLTDISVRINNRRCTILSSSSDTLLKIVYPAMASAAKLLITDTAKHYNVYSRQTIYPTFRQDTGIGFDQKSYTDNFYGYRDFVRTPYAAYQKYFELPRNINTGNLLNTDNCIVNTSDDQVIGVGKMDLKPYIYPSDYTHSRFIFNEEIPTYLYNKMYYNDNEFHLMDINTDGRLDYSDLNDSSAVYFCDMISDTSVEYGTKTKIPVSLNPGGQNMLNILFTEPSDFDMDGINDYMTFSLYSDSIYFFHYEHQSKKMAYLNYLLIEPGSYIYSVSDYTNDGKPDLLFIEYTNNAYRYYVRENISRKGMFRFSDKKMILVDSTNSTNMFFNQYDLDGNNNLDLVLYDNYNHYHVYLADSSKGNTYKLLDSFTRQEPFYNYGDLDGDGKPEMFGIKHAFRYKIENGKFKVYQLDIPDYNFIKASIEDVNGDNVPDMVLTGSVMLNTRSCATFGDKLPMIMESPDFLKTATDSMILYNNGSKNIHLRNITTTDSHYYFHTRTKQSIPYSILIKPGDSFVFYISFKPAIRPKKTYYTLVEAHFTEDMPITCKQVWGYVTLAPVITKVLPQILIPGDTAAIIGKNFDNLRSTPIVNFADARAEIITYDDTLILVKIPYGSMDGVVTIYDTAADLTCFSPLPLNFSFLGTSGPLNTNSFTKFKYSRFWNDYYIYDYNADGLPDIAYDSGTSVNNIASYIKLNKTNFSGFKFNTEDYIGGVSLSHTRLYKDLDGDGLIDYVMVFDGSKYNTFTGQIRGTYSGYIFENSSLPPIECIPTDLNRNGKLELNFGNYGAQTSFYDYNVKAPPYDPCNDYISTYGKMSFSTKPIGHSVYNFDFDGDGIGEVLFEDTAITVAFNKSRKDTFDYTGAVRLSINRRNGYKVADMNNDGKLDIVALTVEYSGVQRLCIFRNTSTKGNLSFVKHLDTLAGMYYANDYFHLRDLNGDQRPEIVIFNSGLTDTFMIHTNESSVNNFIFDKYCKIKTTGEVYKLYVADMNADTKTDLVVQTDSGLFIYRNLSVSGFLSRNSYTFTKPYGFPLSLSLAIYNDGGDTLIIDKIKIPAGYKLVNSGNKMMISGSPDNYSLNGEVTLPIKINVADSFQFFLVKDENAQPGKYKDTFLFYNNQGSKPYQFVMQGEIKPAPLAKLRRETIDFDTLKYKRNSSDSFYLRNIGYDTLKISGIQVTDTTHFKLEYDKSKKRLLVGDSMMFKVKFLALARGVFNADLIIKHNDYTGQSIVNLDGTCIAPEIKDSVIIDFHDRYAYTINFDTVMIRNTGDDTLLITDIRHVNGKPFISSGNKSINDQLLPGDTIKIVASFSPDSIKAYSDHIIISHNAPNTSSKVVLKGKGVAAHFSNNKQLIDLGWLKTGRQYQFTHNINNDGNRKLKIKNMSHTLQGFQSVICPGNPDSIDVNKTGSICLSVLRTQAGAINDTLLIQHNGLDTLAKWYFKARFIKPLPSVILSRPNYAANIYRKDTGSFIIYNNGDDTLFNITHTFNNSNGFAIVDPAGFNGSILPGQSKVFRMEFIPSDTFTKYNKLNIRFGNDTNKFTFPISGRGLKGIPVISSQAVNMIASLNTSSKATRSIRNIGNQSLKITGVQHKNPVFTSTLSKNTINAGDSAMLEIDFHPITYQKWHYDTAIITSMSDSIQYKDTIFLSGKCLYPEIQFSKTGTVQFPATKTMTSSLDSLVILNTGDDTLRIQLSALSSFVQVSGTGPFTILPQKSLSSVIRFTPAIQKTYLDSFKLVSNTIPGKFMFYVSGTGIFNRDNYKLSISKTRIDYGQVHVGLTARDSFDLVNTGTDTLHLQWNTINPPFVNQQGTSVQVLPGQKRAVVINFQPLDNQAYVDTIVITNEFLDSISVIALSGNGHTSVRVLQLSDAIQVYPNPANDVLEVHSKNKQASPLQFKLFDMTGKEISPGFTTFGTSIYIQTGILSNGVYLLSVAMEGMHYQVKVVVQH